MKDISKNAGVLNVKILRIGPSCALVLVIPNLVN